MTRQGRHTFPPLPLTTLYAPASGRSDDDSAGFMPPGASEALMRHTSATPTLSSSFSRASTHTGTQSHSSGSSSANSSRNSSLERTFAATTSFRSQQQQQQQQQPVVSHTRPARLQASAARSHSLQSAPDRLESSSSIRKQTAAGLSRVECAPARLQQFQACCSSLKRATAVSHILDCFSVCLIRCRRQPAHRRQLFT